MSEFVINDYLSVKLENDETVCNEDFELNNRYQKKDYTQLWNSWSNSNHLSIDSSQLTMSFGEAFDYEKYGFGNSISSAAVF